MTPEQIIDLLSTIAAYDQRTVGQADVEAWLDIANDQGWTYPLARRAVRDYHGRDAGKPRITPAAITDAIDAVRQTIRRTVLRTDLTPPRELADDPCAEIAWRRAYVQRATDAALAAWAAGEQLPEPPALEAEPPRQAPPEAIAELIGDTFAVRLPRTSEPADTNQRARMVEAARRELDRVRDRIVESSEAQE